MWTRRRGLTVGAVLAAAAAIGMAVWLLVLPTVAVVTTGTTDTRAASYGSCIYCPLVPGPGVVSLPNGAPARFEWSSHADVPVHVWLQGQVADDDPCYWANATNGSCSFTATGGYLVFAAFVSTSETLPHNVSLSYVSYTVTFWHPYL